jgi:DNA-binding NtrC family response regulator
VEVELGRREEARLMLEANGFDVLEAGEGSAALELSHDHAGPIDLLMTDAVLPTMQGLDLADAIRVDRPGVVVVYMSGYARDAFGEGGVRPAAFLETPLDERQLLKVLRRCFAD